MSCVRWVILVIMGSAMTGCSGKHLQQGMDLPQAMIQEIRDTQWKDLAGKKIYFGHQSVGRDILQGIREWMIADARIHLTIVESKDPAAVAGPSLVHSAIGRNGDPDSKLQEFAAILDRGFGREGGIAMYKHCYVDIGAETDVRQMFARYRDGVGALKARYPRISIVHITLPLTSLENPLKHHVKKILGRVTERDLNLKRARYNELLRQEYGGRDPVFDLSEAESTRADGTRVLFSLENSTAYALATDYTSDGGHLNERGRRAAAARFLSLLAKQ